MIHVMDENTHASQPRPAASKIINLNVGGTTFSTTPDTLAAGGDSFFTGLISDNFKAERDQHNNLFIDRDPKLFNTILNFLRSQCTILAVDKCTRAKLKAIQAEAEFYSLTPLMEEAKKQLDELDEEDRKLDEQRSRHKIQKSRAAKPLSRQCSESSNPEAPSTPTLEQQDEDEEDKTGDVDGDDMESTPLTQGRYVERTHADLISDAARHMDMDF